MHKCAFLSLLHGYCCCCRRYEQKREDRRVALEAELTARGIQPGAVQTLLSTMDAGMYLW